MLGQVSSASLLRLVGSRKRLTHYIFYLEIRGVGELRIWVLGSELVHWVRVYRSMNVIFGPPFCHVSLVIGCNVIKQ